MHSPPLDRRTVEQRVESAEMRAALRWAVEWIERCYEVPEPEEDEDRAKFLAARSLLEGESDSPTRQRCGDCGARVYATLTDQCPACGADAYGGMPPALYPEDRMSEDKSPKGDKAPGDAVEVLAKRLFDEDRRTDPKHLPESWEGLDRAARDARRALAQAHLEAFGPLLYPAERDRAKRGLVEVHQEVTDGDGSVHWEPQGETWRQYCRRVEHAVADRRKEADRERERAEKAEREVGQLREERAPEIAERLHGMLTEEIPKDKDFLIQAVYELAVAYGEQKHGRREVMMQSVEEVWDLEREIERLNAKAADLYNKRSAGADSVQGEANALQRTLAFLKRQS